MHLKTKLHFVLGQGQGWDQGWGRGQARGGVKGGPSGKGLQGPMIFNNGPGGTQNQMPEVAHLCSSGKAGQGPGAVILPRYMQLAMEPARR